MSKIYYYFCKTALKVPFESLRYSMHKLSDFQVNLWVSEFRPSNWLRIVGETTYCGFHRTSTWQRDTQDLWTKYIQTRLKQACALLWTLIWPPLRAWSHCCFFDARQWQFWNKVQESKSVEREKRIQNTTLWKLCPLCSVAYRKSPCQYNFHSPFLELPESRI